MCYTELLQETAQQGGKQLGERAGIEASCEVVEVSVTGRISCFLDTCGI